MKVGDIVRPATIVGYDLEEQDLGIILDIYEDDFGIYYYEVNWIKHVDWCVKGELELVSESG